MNSAREIAKELEEECKERIKYLTDEEAKAKDRIEEIRSNIDILTSKLFTERENIVKIQEDKYRQIITRMALRRFLFMPQEDNDTSE